MLERIIGAIVEQGGRKEDRRIGEVLISLGRRLSAATTRRDVAMATLQAADELLGWDAAFVSQVYSDEGIVRALVVMDLIGSTRQEVSPWSYALDSDGLTNEVLYGGPRMIIGEEKAEERLGLRFGDLSRHSASLMFVPIVTPDSRVGLLSIQSYSEDFYRPGDLQLLQALAEFCGEALRRTTAEEERQRAVEALEREHGMLRGLINAVPDHIYIKDRECRFVINNAGHLSFLGAASQEETLGKTDLEFFPEAMASRFVEDDRRVIETGEALLSREEMVVDHHGRVRWNATSKVPWRNPQGEIVGTFGISRDITARKMAEEELFRSKARYEALVDASEDYIFVVDRDMRFLSANGVAARRYGLSVAERVGKRFHDFIPADLADFYTAQLRRVFETGRPGRYEDSGIAGGRTIYTETQLSPIFDREGGVEAVLGISRDITERKQLEEELRNLSLVDELTGLYNRRGFQTLAEQQLRMAARSCVDLLLVFADLDGLKRINDTHGHQEGDVALIGAAQALRGIFRQSDVVARLGGDEFTVLASCEPGVTEESIRARIRERIAEYNTQGGHPWSLALSVGTVRVNPAEVGSLAELMARADQALYDEKRTRR